MKRLTRDVNASFIAAHAWSDRLRRLKGFLLIAIVTVGALSASGCAGKKYAWRQKLTIEVEANGQTYTGSSVIEVMWWEAKLSLAGHANGNGFKGEAAFVDIPGKGTLFAILRAEDMDSGPTNVAFWALGQAPDPGFVKESFRILSKSQGRSAVLTPEQYPILVSFDDLNDPMSVKKVEPDDLTAAFGPGVRLKSLTISIVKEPMTELIAEKLPWLEPLGGKSLHGKITTRGSPYGLHGGDFKKNQ